MPLLYQPRGEAARAAPLLAGLAALTMLLLGLKHPSGEVRGDNVAFVAPLQGLRGHPAAQAEATPRGIGGVVTLYASKGKDAAEDEVADAEVVGEEAMKEEQEEGTATTMDTSTKVKMGQEGPEWFERRKIDRHKVNSVFFDMFKKPKSFFPHKLQPGDTVRVYYLQPMPTGDTQYADYKSFNPKAMQETLFDGIILNFRGAYHARTMTLRAMVGKGENTMGYEFQFPMHSPLLKKIEVLRRGYIGRNKNAYFMRGMMGKKNAIPLDKERTEMDQMYASLREEDRTDEIPESEYPEQEWDRYPLPIWKQDLDSWEEEKYAAKDVDTRSQYELRVIARYKKRISPSGKYGT